MSSRGHNNAALESVREDVNNSSGGANAAGILDNAAAIALVVPVGAVFAWPSGAEPVGFLELDGSVIDPVVYPELASALGSNTLPDLRGEFIRGWDNGRGVDSGRVVGSDQAATSQFNEVAFNSDNGALYKVINNYDDGGSILFDAQFSHALGGQSDATVVTRQLMASRPVNTALMYIIKHD